MDNKYGALKTDATDATPTVTSVTPETRETVQVPETEDLWLDDNKYSAGGARMIHIQRRDQYESTNQETFTKATLVGIGFASDMVSIVRWSRRWGYIVIDRKSRIDIYGHLVPHKAPKRQYSKRHCPFDPVHVTLFMERSTSGWDIFENDLDDLIIVNPNNDYTKIKCILAKDIELALIDGSTVYDSHLDDESVRLHGLHGLWSEQLLVQGNCLHYMFPQFQFQYTKEQAKDLNNYMNGSFLQAPLEQSRCSLHYVSTELTNNIKDYKDRGQWYSNQKYQVKDLVQYNNALYVCPPGVEDGRPDRTWKLFRTNPADPYIRADGIERIYSVCIRSVQTGWEMMCGHDGIFSIWSISDKTLYLHPSMHDTVKWIQPRKELFWGDKSVSLEQLLLSIAKRSKCNFINGFIRFYDEPGYPLYDDKSGDSATQDWGISSNNYDIARCQRNDIPLVSYVVPVVKCSVTVLFCVCRTTSSGYQNVKDIFGNFWKLVGSATCPDCGGLSYSLVHPNHDVYYNPNCRCRMMDATSDEKKKKMVPYSILKANLNTGQFYTSIIQRMSYDAKRTLAEQKLESKA